MTKNLKEAIDVINELLKYGTHRGACAFTMPNGACVKHVNAGKRRQKKAVRFVLNHGFIPGSKP
jgi:hypothetical protein